MTAYIDPASWVPWGRHSHWLQPWRAYGETPSAARFVDGLGLHLNLLGEDPATVASRLASGGITHARVEVGWGHLAWDEAGFPTLPYLGPLLRALRDHGIRPLILANSNDGRPCPMRPVTRVARSLAPPWSTSVTLDAPTGIVPARSALTRQWPGDGGIVTAVNGTTVTLSAPVGQWVLPGMRLVFNELACLPFSLPGSADYRATLAGWRRYLEAIRRVVTAALGTAGAPDAGFDLEIWNELTFGSSFLWIGNYIGQSIPYQFDVLRVAADIVQASAEQMGAAPALWSGVRVGDGFRNTNPYPASTTEPMRVTALCIHPYPTRRVFPADEPSPEASRGIDALGATTTYSPPYRARFPEYFGTAIQTQTALREMAPIPSTVGTVVHGRDARPGGPVSTWITEVAMAHTYPGMGPVADVEAFKMRVAARLAAFYLHKGAERLYLFGLNDEAGDDVDISPDTLRMLARMRDAFADGLDRTAAPRTLDVVGVSDTHDRYQFAGDGTPAHPPLYDRDVLALLPFRVNATRLVVAYYVMTRDILAPYPPAVFTVRLGGVHGAGATVTAYDPITDTPAPVAVVAASADTLTVQVEVTDAPRLLTIQETS